MKSKLLFAFCSVLLSGCPGTLVNRETESPSAESLPYAVMFYNVENLFYPSDDPGPGDDPFTPAGERRWTYTRYKKKVTALCKVILAAGEWDPPLLIGLCEVENEKVLKDLVFHPLLINYGYSILHRDGPDFRGIDVALLYRREKISYLSHGFITHCLPGRKSGSREILHGTFSLEQDTLDLFINHWSSKYGGEYETEESRIFQSELLRAAADSVWNNSPARKIIMAGDFNDDSRSAALLHLTGHSSIREVIPHKAQGSYKYQGKWELIDHFFIGGRWGRGQQHCSVFSAPFLLEDDLTYTGLKPNRTYSGFQYHGGISDHLPLMLRFSLQADSIP